MLLIQNKRAAAQGATAILQFMCGAYAAYGLSYLTVFTQVLPSGRLIPAYHATAARSNDNTMRKAFLAELGAPVPTGKGFQAGCAVLFNQFVAPLAEEELMLGRLLLREKLTPYQVENVERYFKRPLSAISVAELLREIPALRKTATPLNLVHGAELILS